MRFARGENISCGSVVRAVSEIALPIFCTSPRRKHHNKVKRQVGGKSVNRARPVLCRHQVRNTIQRATIVCHRASKPTTSIRSISNTPAATRFGSSALNFGPWLSQPPLSNTSGCVCGSFALSYNFYLGYHIHLGYECPSGIWTSIWDVRLEYHLRLGYPPGMWTFVRYMDIHLRCPPGVPI